MPDDHDSLVVGVTWDCASWSRAVSANPLNQQIVGVTYLTLKGIMTRGQDVVWKVETGLTQPSIATPEL